MFLQLDAPSALKVRWQRAQQEIEGFWENHPGPHLEIKDNGILGSFHLWNA